MVKMEINIILEIMGRPPEHIILAMSELIEKLGKEFKILSRKIHEPKKIEDSETLYTTFAEISLEIENMGHYFALLFGYMPSHIEIVSPEKFIITNQDFNEVGHKLSDRLHSYDSITKKAVQERDFLLEKLREVSPETFKEITQPKESKEVKKTQKKTKKSKKKD